jgi:SAM-dependent methyltransferase
VSRRGRSRTLRWLDRKLYANGFNWDAKLFRERILAEVRPEHTVLDLGSGAGIVEEMNFRGLVERVYGVDPDERVRMNTHLDEADIAFADSLPYPDGKFDVVYSANVLEHLPDPESAFAEVNRVLKPGGRFLAKTPNFWHYAPIIAYLTPMRFHQLASSREDGDLFPTLYRVNTAKRLRWCAVRAGLVVREIEFVEGLPGYLSFSVPTYLVGFVYERCVNNVPGFERFRCLLVGTFEKPASAVHA